MSTTTSVQFEVLVLCFIFCLFVLGARYRFNRHCPICRVPVLIEWSLIRGVLGYIGDDVVVHRKCHVVWNWCQSLATSACCFCVMVLFGHFPSQ